MNQAPEEHITQVRPRFKIHSEVTAKEIIAKIETALKDDKASCTGKVHHNYITLHIPVADQHYWSPQLTLTLEEEEGVTTIRGMYSPRPAVWTMFVFFYSIIGLAILVVGTLGLSYLMLDKPAFVLWWVPILSILFLSLYLVSFFGQKLGHDQMLTLHHFFENSVEID